MEGMGGLVWRVCVLGNREKEAAAKATLGCLVAVRCERAGVGGGRGMHV